MHKKIIFTCLALIGILFAMILNTNPENSPIIILVVPVVLVGLIVGLATYLLSYRLSSGRFGRELHLFFAFTSGASSALLVVMSSLGQLKAGTGLLMVLFVAVLVFYFRRFRK